MMAPAAEHLAHLLSWALQNKMTCHADARDAVLSSGHRGRLRTALIDLGIKLRAAQANVSKAA